MQEGINKPARSWQPLTGSPKFQQVIERKKKLPRARKETVFSKFYRKEDMMTS